MRDTVRLRPAENPPFAMEDPNANIPCVEEHQLPPRLLSATEAAVVTEECKKAMGMPTVVFANDDNSRPTRAQLREMLGLPLLCGPGEDGGFLGLDEQAVEDEAFEMEVDPSQPFKGALHTLDDQGPRTAPNRRRAGG